MTDLPKRLLEFLDYVDSFELNKSIEYRVTIKHEGRIEYSCGPDLEKILEELFEIILPTPLD